MRVFVAIEVGGGAVLQGIRGVQDRVGGGAGGRRVAMQNMHFTLRFIGDVAGGGADRIMGALRTVSFAPFEVDLAGVGAFPSTRAPQVIWVGTDRAGGDAMAELAARVGEALEPLGLGQRDGERAFRPHLTIFRVKNRIGDITGALGGLEGKRFGRIKVSEFKLKRSRLTPSGPVYSDLGVVWAG